MSETSPTTVSFDLDGVLMQNPFLRGVVPYVREHMRESERLRGVASAEADALIDQAIRETWGERMRSGRFVDAYDWDAIYDEVARAFGAAPVPDVAGLVASFCRDPNMIQLLPGAEEALRSLRDAGLRLVAVTNGFHAFQRPVLVALGIAGYFEDVFTPDRAGFAKPDPRIFALAGSSVHVGDTLLHDVLGPRLAGVTAVWLDAHLPDAIRAQPVADRVALPEFRAYLERMFDTVPYRRFHPEATLATCTPDLVVADVCEAARAILDAAADVTAKRLGSRASDPR